MSDAPVPEEKLAYRLITGADDRSFCERISAALAEGYVLHGSPAVTFNGLTAIVAQAVILPAAVASAAIGTNAPNWPANTGAPNAFNWRPVNPLTGYT